MANTYFKKSKFRPKFRATQCPGRDQEKLSYAVYLLYIKLPLLLLSLSMNLKKKGPPSLCILIMPIHIQLFSSKDGIYQGPGFQ